MNEVKSCLINKDTHTHTHWFEQYSLLGDAGPAKMDPNNAKYSILSLHF